MATLKELRDERLRKLQDLKEKASSPYPAQAQRTHTLQQIKNQLLTQKNQQVSGGRIQAIRKFGKIAFVVIKDQTGSCNCLLGPDQSAIIELLPLLDSGDFVERATASYKDQNR